MTVLASCRAALALLVVAVPASAQQKAVNQQGGAMSAAMSKAKVKKMSNAEIIRSAVSAGPHQIAVVA